MSLDNADTNTNDIIDQLDNDDQEETIIILDEEDGEGAQSSQEDIDDTESSTIKDIRKQLRATQQELNQLKSKPIQQEAPIIVGDKPTFEGCEYDSDKFEIELEAYHDRKTKAANQAKQAETKTQEVITVFNNQVKALNVKDFDNCKTIFNNSFTLDQKNAILTASDNMALVIYALGKSPSKVESLMQINEPIKLAAAIAKIEKDIKVIKSPRNKVEPDKTVKGNASGAASAATGLNKQLEKLREEAKKTGNMNKVVAFKKANNIK